MKKLKPTAAKRVHPSPLPPPSSPFSLLPSALLAVAAALSPHDQETLAYLLDCQKPNLDTSNHRQRHRSRPSRQINHPPQLGCSCFGCYKSYWARWDASPNRHVIDTIIDAFEESLESSSSSDRPELKGKGKGRRRRGGKAKKDEVLAAEEVENREVSAKIEEDGDDGDDEEEEEEEVGDGEGKSSVRRFVSWVFGMNE